MADKDPIRVILDDFRHIVRALRISTRASETQSGLGGAQLFVLRQLEVERSISVNELAERTLTHQSSVSVVVRKLVEQKLVSRRTSVADSRRVELTLTSLGKRKLRSAPRAAQEVLVDALRRMPFSECSRLAELLSKVVSEAGYARGRPPLLFEDETGVKKPAR
jgi:DNA-binding MarR family transcriptional regulator